MADERYRRLLGIEPTGEIPTHYELLVLSRTETDLQLIETAYKEQMRKLQLIRSTKDKGFLEFLKEELRTARLTLTNPDKRRAYDESLIVDAAQGFREWVKPMMALGLVPRGVYDTMLQKGVKDGLTDEAAARVIHEVAAESGATLEQDGVGAPEAGGYGEVDIGEGPDLVQHDEAAQGEPEESYQDQGEIEEPTFTDDLDPESLAPPPAPGRATAPPPARPGGGHAAAAAHAPKIGRGRGFYDSGPAAEAAPASPWARGGPSRAGASAQAPRPASGSGAVGSGSGAVESGSGTVGRPPAPGRRQAESAGTQRERWRAQGDQSAVHEAARLFNLGAKLAKVAGEVHHQLQFYFPPANGRTTVTYQRGGVSYEKVFETEQKTYRDSLQKFQSAVERLGELGGPEADELRSHANQRITLIKGILDEIRQHKLRQLAGLSKAEELRMWQVFVASPRSTRLGQTVGE